MRTALTIAGSDSGGGAGIQADLKSFAAVGVHGTSVITCVTAQNTRSVASIFPLPPGEIRAQVRAVLDDFDVRAVKTGMLYSAEIVGAVAEELRGTRAPLVVDPVMVATVGASLERDDFRDALVERLLPLATLVTPNRHEAHRLSGLEIPGVEDAEAAARAIRGLGPRAVLVKGGHVAGRLVDVFFDGRRTLRLGGFRHDKELHGAGCTLAASIAAYLARGQGLREAVRSARARVAVGFLESYRAGKGVGIIQSAAVPDRFAVWEALAAAVGRVRGTIPRAAAPAGGIEMGFAVAGALREAHVCSVRLRPGPQGRWTPAEGPGFGARTRVARAILVGMTFHPGLRSAISLKYSQKTAHRIRASRFVVAALSGRKAGVTMRAGPTDAEAGIIPQGLTEGGERGRDPRLWVLGDDPLDALRRARRTIREVAR